MKGANYFQACCAYSTFGGDLWLITTSVGVFFFSFFRFSVVQGAGPGEGDARGEGFSKAGAPGDHSLLQRLAREPS